MDTSKTFDYEVVKVTHCEACKRKFRKNEARYGDLGEPLQYCAKCYCSGEEL
jgi:hypothetical protein